MCNLEEHNVITDKQHAFRKHHSCETQLCSVIHDWARNIDKNKQTDIFILDFEKAFDTVPHEQLKAKLYRYGITGKTLMWIDSFLCYRKQCAVVNGTKSKWSVVESGVPQGTVLGPVLFSLHIHDILDNISSDIRLFADDCVCYRVIDSTEDCKILQNDIDKLGSWARKWGMRFQPIKSIMMKLTRKKKHHIDFEYQLEGSKLEFIDNIKYLGVHIANDLRWNKHVHEVTNKANQLFGTDHLTWKGGGVWFFVSFRMFFSDNTRVRIFFFFSRKERNLFPELNIRIYDKNSESDYFFFPPPNSEYFFQQHWESEYFFRKKT